MKDDVNKRLCELLGHKRPEMTRRYAKRTAKRIGEILTMRRQVIKEREVENG